MTDTTWMKPGLIGAGAGAAVAMVLGFTWGGWVTGGAAATMSEDAVVAALVPVCVDLAATDPERVDKLETVRAAAGFQRRSALMATGWATVPGSDAPDQTLAQACLLAIEI
jgi:hypothetical protein